MKQFNYGSDELKTLSFEICQTFQSHEHKSFMSNATEFSCNIKFDLKMSLSDISPHNVIQCNVCQWCNEKAKPYMIFVNFGAPPHYLGL